MKVTAQVVKTEKETNKYIHFPDLPSFTLFQVKNTEEVEMIIPCGHNVGSDIVLWFTDTPDDQIGWDNFNSVKNKYDDCFILSSDKSVELTNEE